MSLGMFHNSFVVLFVDAARLWWPNEIHYR